MASNRPVNATPVVEPAKESYVGATAGFGSMIEHVAPLFPTAAGMLVGIAVDNQFLWSPRASWVAYTFLMIVGLLTFGRRAFGTVSRPLGHLVMAIGVGGLLHLNAQRIPDPKGIAQHLPPDASIVRLIGVVASEPRVLVPRETPFSRWSFRSETMAFVLRAETIATRSGRTPVRGRLSVLLRETIPDLREGEEIEITGFLSPLTPPRNPGAFDWATWRRRQGITANLTCPHRDNVRRLGPLAAPRDSWISSLRSKAAALVTEDAVASDQESGLLDALVLGQRTEIDRSVNDAFVRSGCVHFLAASGTNVAMVASFVWFLSRWFRLARRGGALLVFAAIVLYTLVAEPRPPILRAAITGTFLCAAVAVGRERSVLNWLSAAAIVLLIVDPTTAFDLGFQLSFLAVLGVAYLTGPMTQLLTGAWLMNLSWRGKARERADHEPRHDDDSVHGLNSPQHRSSSDAELEVPAGSPSDRSRRAAWLAWSWRIAATYLAASLGAWLAGMPVVADTFHRVQPYGAVGSCLALPLVYLAMLIGFLRAAIAFVLPVGGELLGLVLRELVATLLAVVNVLAGLPGATVEVTVPPWWWTATFYAFLVVVVLRSRIGSFRRGGPEYMAHRAASFHATAGVHASRPEREVRITLATAKDGALSDANENTGPLGADPCHPRRGVTAAPASIVLGIAATIASAAWAWPRSVPQQLTVTVLSVGNGSATVLELPSGETVLVDGGSRSFADVGRDVVRPFLRSRGIHGVDEVLLTRARLDRFNGVPSALENSSGVPIRVAPGFDAECTQRAPCRELLRLLRIGRHEMDASAESSEGWERGGVKFRWIASPEPPATSDRTDRVAAIRIEFSGRSLLIAPDLDRRDCSAFTAIDHTRADVVVAPGDAMDAPDCRLLMDHVGARILVQMRPTRSSAVATPRSDSLVEREVFDPSACGAVRIVVDASGIRAAYARSDAER